MAKSVDATANRGPVNENDFSSIVDGKMLPNGYQIALACGPLKKARYINPTIEKELAEFKQEIAEKHAQSEMNKTYVFQRTKIVVNSDHGGDTMSNSDRIGTLGDSVGSRELI